MNKYLNHLEKQSSLLAAAAGLHIGQGLLTKGLLHSKVVAKHVAEGFANGTKGLASTGASNKIKQAASGGVSPEIATMRLKANEAGHAMKPILEKATKRQQVGLRLLSQGNVPQIQKFNLHKDPVVQSGAKLLDKHLPGAHIHKRLGSIEEAIDIKAAWNKKGLISGNPVLHNVIGNISRGKVGAKVRPGMETAHSSIAGAVASGVVEPIAGVFNTSKAIMASKRLQGNKYGKKITSKLEKVFVNNPIKAGASRGAAVTKSQKAGDFILEHGVNPVSGALKRAAGDLKSKRNFLG